MIASLRRSRRPASRDGADFVKRRRVDPEAGAMRALERFGGTEHDGGERFAAARVWARRGDVFLGALDFCSAMLAELRAGKNHAETRGAGDRGQAGAAMFAGRGVARARRAAHRAVERRGFHGCALVLHETCRACTNELSKKP